MLVTCEDEAGAPKNNLFMRPTSRNECGEVRHQRAITPISMRELDPCAPENLMDKTLDQYIEDLREANKQVDQQKAELTAKVVPKIKTKGLHAKQTE